MTAYLPSLRGLAALRALARHGGQRAAAEALGITRSALSHRIADLETELGTALIAPRGRASALTEEGAALLAATGDALDRIEAAAAPLRRRRQEVRLSTVDTLASNWLLPRLPAFRRAHPEIAITILTTRRAVDLATEDIDCAIRHGRGGWPGLAADPLFRETLVPVAMPGAARGPAAGWPVIRARARFGDWERWWRATGQGGAPAEAGILVENRAQALEAARAGAGVALTDARYVEAALASGQLVALGPVVALEEAYHFLRAPNPRNPRHVEALRVWLLGQAGAAPAP
ncbi:LysR substrate-binding domain-containing protein [Amaricoccus solimangrovi]|uniref:LysR family transcriptional regulator n=1 Tax=Amaricoccus solimangrovi TaxID=2589815 RepID=A0A501WBW2_9RHOB|nr:LysR substrate-binding domain-containing protein [Amaricoccus solimangrovi]TPE46888.1 LysR family transcriptional regulator [Amaricoccus solimangrovi]